MITTKNTRRDFLMKSTLTAVGTRAFDYLTLIEYVIVIWYAV